ncbi:MAG TPA: PQQ-dependent sugar dehydrogenase [Candidatus Krumholzibacteria bacterium]|nr:PQQ-dependent sugar dehydrogenase [Candidatus Krumholzibacteria bacterium]
MNRLVIIILIICVLFIPGAVHATYVFDAFPNLAPIPNPIGIVDPLDGTDRLFIVLRAGFIYVMQNDPTVTTRTRFLDINAMITAVTEGGLLGLAFHPNYENNGYFYITYTAENPRREVLARYSVDPANPSAALPGSALVILEIPKTNLYHNGGCITFGPDGYLYWSLGEDGIAQYAQDLTKWNGKLLRIDVDHPSGGNAYGIPAGNPFAGAGGGVHREIWAYGFRNPWRFSFDPPTGRLWLGDVGENSWEEIDIIRKGRNYGWPRMEGNDCFSPSTCDTTGLSIVLPLYEYSHDGGGGAITGGFVYRGPSIPSLFGKYIYADYITGDLSALSWDGVNPPTNTLLENVSSVPSFGVDKDNELFMVSFDGTIYRLFATPTTTPTPGASRSAITASPNPFASSTHIEFTAPASARVALDVFDVAGHRVAVLANENVAGGAGAVEWSGRDTTGQPLRSGVYFLRLSVNGKTAQTHRVTLVR